MEHTDQELLKTLYELVIGRTVIKLMESLGLEELYARTESEMAALLTEIRDILNDGALDDPECFRRIDALVDAFHARGIQTNRHSW